MSLLLTLSGQEAKQLREHSKLLNPYFLGHPVFSINSFVELILDVFPGPFDWINLIPFALC